MLADCHCKNMYGLLDYLNGSQPNTKRAFRMLKTEKDHVLAGLEVDKRISDAGKTEPVIPRLTSIHLEV
jgi:hypothetical protein